MGPRGQTIMIKDSGPRTLFEAQQEERHARWQDRLTARIT